ncbi:MAG: CvpA family protein [Fuerstiella sp.]|jgi:membrane protein required for colicin V production|nr:CvpA family protein [Fuerstiella sp.]MDG2130438.1 CvpA family protein [Fuerstiella sp.]
MVSWYDFVVLAILFYTAWQGAQRGLLTQLAWIAALVLCFKFADKLAPSIEPMIDVEQPLRHWISMFILYLGFSLGSFMLARILNSWLEKANFKDFDRHLGGVFGFVKGAVICLVGTFFSVTLSDSLKSTVLASRSGEAACYILDHIEPLTPEYFHEYLEKYKSELKPLHENLGHETSLPELWGDGHSDSAFDTEHRQLGDEFRLPDLFDGLGDATEVDSSDSPNPSDTGNGLSLDEMLRRLPQRLRQQFAPQLQQYWNSATVPQKQGLAYDVSRSLPVEMPDVLSDFLSRVAAGTGPLRGSRAGRRSFSDLLNEIGDIYQDRQTITQRTREHFVGIPPDVQQAVVEDWSADLRMEANDPDPQTTVSTRLDERIVRQLEKARVSWNSLSFDLQQRLNQSLR